MTPRWCFRALPLRAIRRGADPCPDRQDFLSRYGTTVIGMRKHGAVVRGAPGDVRLAFGDTLLLRGPRPVLERIKREPGFIVTEQAPQEVFRTTKIPLALLILAGVVAAAALGVPILVTATVGCVLMVATGCLKVSELHDSIRWDVILLLAGIIPLGLVLEKSGGAKLLADLAARAGGHVPPVVVLMIFYVVTAVLTEMISNNASVVLLVPVAVITARDLGLDPRAVILAVMFAASTSFSTPVGYQTNMMVYGPGGYRFFDFTRVGSPLNLILAAATPIFIYLLWGV